MSQIYLKQMYCIPLLCIGSWNPMYQGQRIWSHLSVSYIWPAPCSRTRREALGLQLGSLLIWSSQPAYAANGSEGKKSTRELRDIIVQDFQTRQCKALLLTNFEHPFCPLKSMFVSVVWRQLQNQWPIHARLDSNFKRLCYSRPTAGYPKAMHHGTAVVKEKRDMGLPDAHHRIWAMPSR